MTEELCDCEHCLKFDELDEETKDIVYFAMLDIGIFKESREIDMQTFHLMRRGRSPYLGWMKRRKG